MSIRKTKDKDKSKKAIKYRAYPTEEQAVLLAKTFGCCRLIWNSMLGDRNAHYKETKETFNLTPAMYKEKYPFLKEVDSLSLANVQINLNQAFSNFFSDAKKYGFPKFKSKKNAKKSYTTNNVNSNIELLASGVKLPKLGIVKARIHRMPKENWMLKSATISQEKDGTYYISLLYAFDKEVKDVSIDCNNAIGLDYKSDGLYTDANGNIGSQHKFFRESQVKLAKEQRRLSRMVEGSNNYKKQKIKVARIHKHIANQRKDFLHKTSTKIANSYDVVCVENLDMKAMSNKGFGNGKATLDNGYGMFLRMLEYKLADREKYFIKVDKWYPSSQQCHECGQIHPEMKDLKVRKIVCDCGYTADRDLNAAKNILDEGLRILAA